MANCTGNSDTHTAEAPLSHSLDMLHWNLNCLLVWTWLPENRNWRVRHSLVGSDFFGCSLFSGGVIDIYVYIHTYTHTYIKAIECVSYIHIYCMCIYIYTHIYLNQSSIQHFSSPDNANPQKRLTNDQPKYENVCSLLTISASHLLLLTKNLAHFLKSNLSFYSLYCN